jgi:hypothetical protein
MQFQIRAIVGVARPEQPRSTVFVQHEFCVQGLQVCRAMRRHFQVHGANDCLKQLVDRVVLTNHQSHLRGAAQLTAFVRSATRHRHAVALECFLFEHEVLRADVAVLGQNADKHRVLRRLEARVHEHLQAQSPLPIGVTRQHSGELKVGQKVCFHS